MQPTAVLILGVPLLILGMAAAVAGELKPAAGPVDEACARYGPGFVPVSGTTSCIRVAGRARAEAGAVKSRVRDGAGATGASGRVSVDARTQTELGPARAFVRFGTGRVTGADKDR